MQNGEIIMKSEYEKMGGTYHEENGYLIPDMIVPETRQVGKWGRRYLQYLMRAKRALYTSLLFSGKLSAHLEEIDRTADEMMDRLTSQTAAQEGVTEQLKAENQMEWVRHMNSIRSRVEEIVWDEITN